MKKKAEIENSCASCAYCPDIPCIKLYERGDDVSIGGELYLYNQLTNSRIIDEQIESCVCSNGYLLQCACFITTALYELFPEEFLAITSNELVRDMKASFYLAMSGHYRQAILIQRSVLENFLYGLFFHTEVHRFSRNDQERQQVKKRFKSWIDGGYRKSDDYLLEIIQKGGIISSLENKTWGKLFNSLSQFVHTISKTPTGKSMRYKNFDIKSCYAQVEFDKDSLIEWSGFFQKVIFLILHKIITLFPSIKKEDAVKLALKLMRDNFKNDTTLRDNVYLASLLKMRAGKTTSS